LPTLARAGAWSERGLAVAVIVGDPGAARDDLSRAARRALGPEEAVIVAAPGAASALLDPSWLAGRAPVAGRPAAYLCRGVECSLPVGEAAQLLALAAPRDGA
jgi:hypothetical protein